MCDNRRQCKLQNNINCEESQFDNSFQTRHVISDENKLRRDGKTNSRISLRWCFPFPTNWWNRLEKGRERLVSVIYLSSLSNLPPPHSEISHQPLPAISHPRNEPRPPPRLCSSRLALIQLKTPDDRAKQRRIDHENFNWCYRYERVATPEKRLVITCWRTRCMPRFRSITKL